MAAARARDSDFGGDSGTAYAALADARVGAGGRAAALLGVQRRRRTLHAAASKRSHDAASSGVEGGELRAMACASEERATHAFVGPGGARGAVWFGSREATSAGIGRGALARARV